MRINTIGPSRKRKINNDKTYDDGCHYTHGCCGDHNGSTTTTTITTTTTRFVFLITIVGSVFLVFWGQQHFVNNNIQHNSMLLLDEFVGRGLPCGSSGGGSHSTTKTTQSLLLAYQQSYGFFDDIPDEQWNRLQEIHSKMFPNYYEQNIYKNLYSTKMVDLAKYMDQIEKSSFWYGENFQIEFHCPYAQRLPTDSMADGPKWVCDPHRLRI
jgi:hypothetical protein